MDAKQQDLVARFNELKEKKESVANGKGLTDKELKEFRSLKSLLDKRPKFGNDFGWWSKVPVLLKDAANLTTNWIAGTPIAQNDISTTPYGVLAVHLLSVYGSNETATDPINVWARDLFLRMFQKWRGISAYGAPDLAIVILAELEFLKGIEKAERIYGIVNRYSKRNVNMPYVELAALGINMTQADAIRDHLSDYRYDLNTLIRRAQRLCIPKDIALIPNIHSLEGCEYLDHDNDKGQIIIFTYDEMGEYNETLMQSGGCIEFTNITNMGGFIDFTQDNCFPVLSRALDSLMNSDSVQKVLGDLVTWFGEEQMLQLLPVPEDYIVVPVYAESMLHKLHNMECSYFTGANMVLKHTIPASGLSAADVNTLQGALARFIYQTGSNVYTKCSTCSTAMTPVWRTVNDTQYLMGMMDLHGHIHQSHLLDTYRVEAREETIVEGALWKVQHTNITDSYAGTNYYADLIEGCFEIVNSYVLLKNTGTGISSNTFSTCFDTAGTTYIVRAGQLAVIDWAPLQYNISASSPYYVVDVAGDIDTPIVLSGNSLRRIHTACFYSGLQTDVRVIAK